MNRDAIPIETRRLEVSSSQHTDASLRRRCLPKFSFPRLKMRCTSRRENSSLDERGGQPAAAHRVSMGSYEGLWHVTRWWFPKLFFSPLLGGNDPV